MGWYKKTGLRENWKSFVLFWLICFLVGFLIGTLSKLGYF